MSISAAQLIPKTQMRHTRRYKRRAIALYLTTLCVALALTLVAVSTAATMVSQARATTLTIDAEQARIGAVSALEWAVQSCNSNASWRSGTTHGVPVLRTMSRTALSYTLFDDADNSLSNDPAQSVRIVAGATCGVAKQRVSVVARPQPLNCLMNDMTAAGQVQVGTGNGLTIDILVAANDRVENTGTIAGSVASVNSTSNSGVITGTVTDGIVPRDMPTAAMSYYLGLATPMAFASIPISAGTPTIQNRLISPTQNPYGATNVQGIYVVDCGGSNIIIDSCRIVGTLIIVNPGSASFVRNTVNWVAAVSNFPALLVSGNLTINLSGATLSETTAGANFNPADTPYQGVGDTDTLGVYPCLLQGIVYATGNLTLTGSTRIDGVVLAGGNIPVTGLVAIKYLATYANNPPPGFVSHRLDIAPGSWSDM